MDRREPAVSDSTLRDSSQEDAGPIARVLLPLVVANVILVVLCI